jgi:hypothetical protein
MTIREELIECGAITSHEDVTELRGIDRPVLRLDAAARKAIQLELASGQLAANRGKGQQP